MRRRPLLATSLVTLLLAFAGGVTAGSALAAEAPGRSQVIEGYQTVLEPALRIPTGFTGNVAACDPGTISAEDAAATLTAVNYMRGLAGLSPVVLNAEQSSKAQASALIMAANGQLSHEPSRDSRCWTKAGFDGASHGNLSLGWSDPPGAVPQATGPRAVVGYLADSGDSNTAAGHRRWLLWQGLEEIGTGDTDLSNTIVVVPESLSSRQGRAWVPWPAAGAFPRELEPGGRWSLSYPGADFSRARITMQAPGGKTIGTSAYQVSKGFGDNTIAWEASLPESYRSARTSTSR